MATREVYKPGEPVPKTCYYLAVGSPGAAPGRQTWLEEGTTFPEEYENGLVVNWLMIQP